MWRCTRQRSSDKTFVPFHPPNRKAACLKTHVSRCCYQNHLPDKVFMTERPPWNYSNYNQIKAYWKKGKSLILLWWEAGLSGDDSWIVLVLACRLVGVFFATFLTHDVEKRPHSNNGFVHQCDILNVLWWVWYLKVVCCATYMRGDWGAGGSVTGSKEALMSKYWDKGVCFVFYTTALILWLSFF